MKYAFWNTRKNQIEDYIFSLIVDNGINVVVLAEYNETSVMNLTERAGFHLITCAGCDHISILSDRSDFEMGPQNSHYSIQIVGNDYLLCCLHLASSLFQGASARREIEIDSLCNDLKSITETSGLSEVVFVGDFNEDPYSKNILNVGRFHALPSFGDLENEFRTVEGSSFRKFYNPMWNLMGDKNCVPGTFYYSNSPDPEESYWHMLDQVIISKGLKTRFDVNKLEIITKTSQGPLKNDKGVPDKAISDHFPIVFEIGDRYERL